MPEITQIQVQAKNKKRCNVFIDGEFYVALSIETAIKYGLKKGINVQPNELNEIAYESEKGQALSKAVEYVTKALKTKRQVKEYLLKKGYSEEIAWYCIDKLKEYNYVDDKEYSKRFIESTAKNQGKRLSAYKLMQKGVKKEDIESAYEQADIDENQNALLLAEKYLKNKIIDEQVLAKAYRYLIGKGFNYDQVSFALRKFKKDD